MANSEQPTIADGVSKKRKKKPVKSKKRKIESEVDFIPWKDVTPQDSIALLAGSDESGFMCLEEIDGEYYSHFNGDNVEEQNADEQIKANEPSDKKAKSVKKRKRKDKKDKENVLDASDSISDTPSSQKAKSKKRKKESVTVNDSGQQSNTKPDTPMESKNQDICEEDENLAEILPSWIELRLHWKIMKALATLKFTEPTPIQKACIPAAAHQGKDVIGAAETGSGKTLAYVIPILQRLLQEEDKTHVSNGNETLSSHEGPLRALIVTPTRELSLQVCDHFREAAKYTTVKVVAIVGGMSQQKQERLLKRKPEVIVGTPGRLWELMSVGDPHLTDLHSLSFFVLDEADRMVEKGHFQELHSIINMLPVVNTNVINHDVADLGNGIDSGIANVKKRRQTFVFSATLSLPIGFRKKLKKAHEVKQQNKNNEFSVASLSERAGVRPNTAIIDLTTQNIMAAKLEESSIHCREEEKDMYLYYILKLHGEGRAIIFCTSIAAVRHVAALLGLLQVQAWPLHAQMQQRQRLKAMDRFCGGENTFLISTDVAARGLDIPDVRTVIHYQLPHSAEVYVHRSGRTARASRDGCSIMFVSPSDKQKYNTLCSALAKKDGLPSFPINRAYIPSIIKRIQLAQKVDALTRKNSQARAKSNWFKRNADALGVEIEDNDDENDENNQALKSTLTKKEAFELKKLQQELNDMLEEPLEPKAFSHRFITGAGISPLVADQLKEYAKQKAVKKQTKLFKKTSKIGIGNQKSRKGLVVIGQQMVEPLAMLQRLKK